jgi:hypothetical protein
MEYMESTMDSFASRFDSDQDAGHDDNLKSQQTPSKTAEGVFTGPGRLSTTIKRDSIRAGQKM